ncbi:MAG: HD domain-containing protein [Eubacterium sp.]|nr:HD domain-containing protein [Eubacterium sp.]
MFKIGYDESIVEIIHTFGDDIINDERFEEEKNYIQHGTLSTYTHSLCVTYISVWLALRSKKKVDMRALVRGALLHDYFLYDWHEKNEYHNTHGFTHAKRSMANARRDFDITEHEAGIIYSHMFPLNLTHIPASREARIVCWADKLCAGIETISLLHYSSAFAGV